MKKKVSVFIGICIVAAYSWAQTVTIVEAGGWFESAYIKWQPVDNAECYHVFYSGEGITKKEIDDQLIRDYGTYFRADILGLKAGSYTISVAPVVGGIEGDASISGTISVDAHDRTGFAFSNSRVPGAYNADGTPKSGAVILYITENTKNTIALEVTGATTNPCVGLQTILEGFKKGKDSRPLIIRLVGQVTDLNYMDKGDIVIENNNLASGYITFEGVGEDAVADGWGIRIKNASNVEIRNIGIMNCNSNEGDNIGLQQNNEYIWVHHCDFFYGSAGSDSDQAKGDGALDCKKSTYVTFSYNHFWDAGKCNLLGLSEGTTDGYYITYHHNWYDHSDSRHPRVRYYSAHVFNNYYDGNAKYGVGSTLGSSVFVEGNYFRNCKYPILTSMQGSDVYDENTGSNDYSDMPTFSKEDGGTIKAYNNYMTGQKRFVAYGNASYSGSTTDFDAYVASTRDEKISSSVVSAYGNNIYNNFDTDASVMYTYSSDSPEEAKTKVVQYSGRMNGGDFSWTFNNATDDVSYAVNTELKTALTSYKTNLIAVQGDTNSVVHDTTGTDNPGDGNSDNTGGNTDGNEVHNFTLSGTNNTFYNISGNLSDSKGTVKYEDLTLTQCLKIESSTSISFTTTKESRLTLVFNEDYNGRIKINGTSHSATNGVLSLALQSGSYEITKDEVANLYYMSVVYNNTSDGSDNPDDTTNNTEISEMDNSGSPELILFPNPVSDYLNINTDVNISRTEIYCNTGYLVIRVEGSTNTINLSDLSKGSYIVYIYTEKSIFKRFIIKE